MKKIIICGGPHTGKTTVLNLLQKNHPELYYVPEPATLLIESELKKEMEDPAYSGVFPWIDYPKFFDLVVKESQNLESEIPANATAILDRSLIDNIAYANLADYKKAKSIVLPFIKKASYDLAFLCDFVGTYTQTEVRKESFEEAKKIHKEIAKAYEESGVKIIDLPAISTKERLNLIRNTIDLIYRNR